MFLHCYPLRFSQYLSVPCPMYVRHCFCFFIVLRIMCSNPCLSMSDTYSQLFVLLHCSPHHVFQSLSVPCLNLCLSAPVSSSLRLLLHCSLHHVLQPLSIRCPMHVASCMWHMDRSNPLFQIRLHVVRILSYVVVFDAQVKKFTSVAFRLYLLPCVSVHVFSVCHCST